MRSNSPDAVYRGISMFVHGLAFFTALGYGVYHFFFQSLLIAGLSLIACVGISISQWKAARDQDNHFQKYLSICALTMALVVTSHDFGYRGLILVFPLTASFLFLLRFQLAIVFSLIAIFSTCIAALNVLDVATVVRFNIALLLSTGFSAAFAYSLKRQKEASDSDANEDFLTGSSSRRGFTIWLDSLSESNEASSSVLTLFYIDIDDFKAVNDAYGHALGDELLSMFCQRVLKCLRSNEKVIARDRCVNFSRLAGDEFALAIKGMVTPKAAELVASRLIEQLRAPFVLLDAEVWVHVSIGILQSKLFPGQAESLLNRAGKAMYDAKQRGKNQYQFFDAVLADTIRERQRIEMGLVSALRDGAFELKFMPVYDCRSLKVVGAEVLLRCTSAEIDGVGPDRFVTIAEQQGLIREIDLMVLEKAFASIREIVNNEDMAELWFAINISAQELYNREFPSALVRLIGKYEIPPGRIELEITETSLVSHDDTCMEILRQIKSTGVRLSLDDFGTGYTAFNQLVSYPIDKLKIDRSFVGKLKCGNEKEPSIVDIVLAIAGHYGLDVVAEGVENPEQLDYLRARQCRYVQGYLLCKPIDWSEFLRLASRSIDEYNEPDTAIRGVVSLDPVDQACSAAHP